MKTSSPIIGTLLTSTGPRAFWFDDESGHVELDRYDPRHDIKKVSPGEQNKILSSLQAKAGIEILSVRFGEYFCHTCQKWHEATPRVWSYGLCLSCAMDRDSDLAK